MGEFGSRRSAVLFAGLRAALVPTTPTTVLCAEAMAIEISATLWDKIVRSVAGGRLDGPQHRGQLLVGRHDPGAGIDAWHP